MIRFATLLFVLTWNTAMAVESYKSVDTPMRPPTGREQYLQSQRGQEAQAITDMLLRGDREGYNQAYYAFRQKYGIPLDDMQALKMRRQMEPQQGSQYTPPMLPMLGGANQ